MIRINTIRDSRKGQAVLEFSLFFVIIVIACVAIQGYVNRSLQGRIRTSSDTIGSQFSPLLADIGQEQRVDIQSRETTADGITTRTTHQDYQESGTSKIDSYAAEWE